MHIWKTICAHFEEKKKIYALLENRSMHFRKKIFVHIWKTVCAHLETDLCTFGKKDLLGILQFAFMPGRADNDAAGGRVFGGNLWMQGRNTGLQQLLLQSQKQIYCFQVYLYFQVYLDPARPTTRLTAQYVGLNLLRWGRVLSKISVDEMIHLCLRDPYTLENTP